MLGRLAFVAKVNSKRYITKDMSAIVSFASVIPSLVRKGVLWYGTVLFLGQDNDS